MIFTSEATGAVFCVTNSEMVVLVESQASPELALLPLPWRTAMSTLTVPLPVEGATQSNVHPSWPELVCVALVPV